MCTCMNQFCTDIDHVHGAGHNSRNTLVKANKIIWNKKQAGHITDRIAEVDII